jgi:hypothetical protein
MVTIPKIPTRVPASQNGKMVAEGPDDAVPCRERKEWTQGPNDAVPCQGMETMDDWTRRSGAMSGN